MIYEKFEIEAKEKIYPLYKKSKIEYDNAVYKQKQRFKNALFKEYKVEGNSKAEKAWAMAWEGGHSGGYYEVELCFIKYVGLIKRVEKELSK